MNLIVDIGNSFAKVAFFENGEMLKWERMDIEHVEHRTCGTFLEKRQFRW